MMCTEMTLNAGLTAVGSIQLRLDFREDAMVETCLFKDC